MIRIIRAHLFDFVVIHILEGRVLFQSSHRVLGLVISLCISVTLTDGALCAFLLDDFDGLRHSQRDFNPINGL